MMITLARPRYMVVVAAILATACGGTATPSIETPTLAPTAAASATTKTSGLAVPLATSGTFTFTLTGNMTIKGKTHEVSFDVTAKRDGGDLTATATANPSWKFGDFGMSAPAVPLRVVSVTDEIRAAIDIVATGPKG